MRRPRGRKDAIEAAGGIGGVEGIFSEGQSQTSDAWQVKGTGFQGGIEMSAGGG